MKNTDSKYQLNRGDKILVYSNLGRKIAEKLIQKDSPSYDLGTQTFESGIYVLQIQKGNGISETFKFTVQH